MKYIMVAFDNKGNVYNFNSRATLDACSIDVARLYNTAKDYRHMPEIQFDCYPRMKVADFAWAMAMPEFVIPIIESTYNNAVR